MAQITDLDGLRGQYLTSIYGRRLALDVNGLVVGPPDIRVPTMGFTDGTTIISSAAADAVLPAYGVSVIGSTLTSASTGLTLAAPIPGVTKTIINGSSGTATVTLVTGGIGSSGSISSTQTVMTFAGRGANIQLQGITTAVWAILGAPISSVSTMVSVA